MSKKSFVFGTFFGTFVGVMIGKRGMPQWGNCHPGFGWHNNQQQPGVQGPSVLTQQV